MRWMILAMVKVLPLPVTPFSVCIRLPASMLFTRASMASGWSPVGWKGDTSSNRSLLIRPPCRFFSTFYCTTKRTRTQVRFAKINEEICGRKRCNFVRKRPKRPVQNANKKRMPQHPLLEIILLPAPPSESFGTGAATTADSRPGWGGWHRSCRAPVPPGKGH